MSWKKKSCIVLAVLMLSGMLAGCAGGGGSDKVAIRIGNWPAETQEAELAVYEGWKAEMERTYPDIEIVPDSYNYNTQTFFTLASSGQLPTIYLPPLTEIEKIVNAGYAADLTKYMNEYSFSENLNPSLRDLVTFENKVYAVPTNVYAIGLFCNRELFEQAGLVNSDGSLQAPTTYEELATTAQTIHEKTGAAGFSLGTMNNNGGWLFMEIAWSHGVKFMEERDGQWVATFNSPECVKALEYVKDLKWKYNALPENGFIDQAELRKLFGTNQSAMYFATPPEKALVRDYGMSKDDIYVARVPEGPAGRYSQMGGQVCMVSPDATPEQIDAVFKWLEITGKSPKTTEQTLASLEAEMKSSNEAGWIVAPRNFYDIWVNEDRLKAESEIRAKYTNVDPVNFDDYYSFSGVIVKPEEPMECQALYGAIDAMIQAVLTDKNADCAALVEKAASDFQLNNLDNLK